MELVRNSKAFHMKSFFALFFLSISLIASSHSGRTDSSGGHYNRSMGVYHYHSPVSTVYDFLNQAIEADVEAARLESERLRRQLDEVDWDEAAKELGTLFDKVGGFFSGPKKESKPKIPDAYYSTSSNDYKQKQIDESIRNYSGSCPCPYSRANNGSLCGKRSAWSKPGGQKPKCYFSDL